MTKLSVNQIRQLLRENGMKSSGNKRQITKRAQDAGLLVSRAMEKNDTKNVPMSKAAQRKAKRERLKREREEERARRIEEEAKSIENEEDIVPRSTSNITLQQTWKEFGAHTIYHKKFEKNDDVLTEEDIAGLRFGHDLLGSCKNGDIPHIIHLVKNTDINPNYQDHMGRSGIHWAAWEGRADVVNCLANLGADVNLPDRCGQRPVHFAAQGGYLPVINALITQHADINIHDFNKNSAVQYAAYWNFCEIVEQLIVYGGSVHEKGKTFSSVLHYGRMHPKLDVSIQSGLRRAKRAVRSQLMNVVLCNERFPEVIVNVLLELIYLA